MTISTQRLRLLRGNSAAAGAFTGLQGELVFDTTLYTLRLQDGLTPGGYRLATSADLANVSANLNYGNANVAAYLITYSGNLTAGNILSNNYLYANGVNILTGIQSNYGNANVAAYLVANPQPGTYSNTNVASYLPIYSGNITGNYFLGNGRFLSGIDATSIQNGNSNVKVYENGNVSVTTAGANTWNFGTAGQLTVPGAILTASTSKLDLVGFGTNTAYLTTTADDSTALFMGAAVVDLRALDSISIATNTDDATYLWTFAADGNLSVPGSLNFTSSPAGVISGVSSISTGTMNASGNVTIAGNITAGNLIGTHVGNASGTIATYSGNITANVGTFNTIYGTIGTASQTGITTVGTLTGLAVTGTTNMTTLQVSGNATIGNLVVTGNSTIIGNITQISGNSGQFFGNAATGFNALYTGIAAGYTPLQQTIVQSSGNYNDYVQINLENINSGSAATADYIVTADNGTDATYYVDMGIASSNFDGLSPNIVGNSVRANDAYLYTLGNGAGNQGGNLIVGAGTVGKIIKFIAGGGHDHDVVATVAAGNFTVNGNITGTYISGNGSQLTGVTAVTATTAAYVTGLTSANVTTALGFVPANSNAASNYGNTNVAAYLPTYSGNISVGNIIVAGGSTISNDTSGGSLLLSPNSSAAGFPGVQIGGAGRIKAPNGSVHMILNTSDVTVQVALKSTITTAATSTTTGALQIPGGAGFGGNIYSGGAVIATGNVTGNFFIGNGALLTGIAASSNYGNSNVTSFLGEYGSNTIVTTGNISGGFFIGNGALLTGIVANGANYSNTNVAAYLPVYGGPINANTITGTANATVNGLTVNTSGVFTTTLRAAGGLQNTQIGNATPATALFTTVGSSSNTTVAALTVNGTATIGSTLGVVGNITANYYSGNGSQLTGMYSNTSVATYLLGNIVVGNISGNDPNVTLVANTYSYVFSNVGNVSFPGNLTITNGVTIGTTLGVTGNLTANSDVTITGNLTVNGINSGYAPNRPAFRVTGNGGAIVSPQTVQGGYFVVDYNQGSYLNTTNGLFTAPIAGLYQVNLIVRTNSNSLNGISQAIIRKTAISGGAVTAQIMVEFAANTSMNHTGGSTIVKMAAGDTLKFDVTAGTLSWDGNDNWSVAYIG